MKHQILATITPPERLRRAGAQFQQYARVCDGWSDIAKQLTELIEHSESAGILGLGAQLVIVITPLGIIMEQ